MAVDAQRTGTHLEADGDVIVTEGLTKVFAGRGGPLRAVESLDLRVHRGEIFGLLGPNGAGKTTTVGMLSPKISPRCTRRSRLSTADEPAAAGEDLGEAFRHDDVAVGFEMCPRALCVDRHRGFPSAG